MCLFWELHSSDGPKCWLTDWKSNFEVNDIHVYQALVLTREGSFFDRSPIILYLCSSITKNWYFESTNIVYLPHAGIRKEKENLNWCSANAMYIGHENFLKVFSRVLTMQGPEIQVTQTSMNPHLWVAEENLILIQVVVRTVLIHTRYFVFWVMNTKS